MLAPLAWHCFGHAWPDQALANLTVLHKEFYSPDLFLHYASLDWSWAVLLWMSLSNTGHDTDRTYYSAFVQGILQAGSETQIHLPSPN